VKKYLSGLKSILPILTFAIICMLSCNSIDIPGGAPDCLKEKIKEFKKSMPCEGATADEYVFQNMNVYVMDVGPHCCCDRGSAVYDQNCSLLGSLGGFTGNLEINGVKFSENAEYVRTIWEKK
jgi:hypothetical protein